MNFRTRVEIPVSADRIDYSTPVMLIGSCFAQEIGRMFGAGRMDVMVNPSGILFNPVSVSMALESLVTGSMPSDGFIDKYESRYLSYLHDTSFSSPTREELEIKVRSSLEEGRNFLARSRFLFVTFGTAWVYKLKRTGEVVSNCHRIPDAMFERELSEIEEMKQVWDRTMEFLLEFNKDLKIVFTVSPVRHWKDGAHGNQLSKSRLLLLADQLVRSHGNYSSYFPSYEIVVDELRDYRFYGDDMVHPSNLAVEYIWERLGETYLDRETLILYKEIARIGAALDHRIMSEAEEDSKRFGEAMARKIMSVMENNPGIKLEKELEYFRKLAST